MLKLAKARFVHGYQAIPNPLKTVINPAFPGVPQLSANADLALLNSVCPNLAFGVQGLDLGLCIFCGKCERKYPQQVVFQPDFRLAADNREKLIVRPGQSDYVQRAISSKLDYRYRRSFAMRNVSAGGCNACELEFGACFNVNFDMGRYGIEVVASPRHADALILTGPVTSNMAYALQETWKAMPEPALLILNGTCAISGGVFAGSESIDRSFLNEHKPVLYIPGCPAHPLSIIHGLASLMGRK